jgi:outer membrane biosynthesis protein TonB
VPPSAEYLVAAAPTRLTFWQFTLRAVAIIVALVSTSALAYFLLTERSQLLAQLKQDPPQAQQPQRPQSAEQMAQQATPPQQRQPAEQMAQQATPPQQPQQPEPPLQRLPMPQDDVLLMLIRSSLMALNQANATGNYTVFRELAAPGFQEANTAARLAEVFAELRSQQFDLSPTLLLMPKLFSKPEMSPNGKLRVTGFFPSEPERVNFDFIFQPVRGQWKLFGIRVKTTPAPREAPQAPAAEAAKPEPTPAPKVEAPAKPAPQAAKPAAPARKAAEKPKPAETEDIAPDVRDRIDNPPPPSPAAKPKEKSIWNPFGR